MDNYDILLSSDIHKWIGSPVNGVWEQRCGNVNCARLAPNGYEDFNFCPYCGVEKIRVTNNINESIPPSYLHTLQDELKDLWR